MKNFIKNNLGLFIVIAISFGAVLPFFTEGLFPMHDDTQVVRTFEMTKSLNDGQFPVRWVKDLGYGYGYPLFNFYAPLPYYVGAIFNAAGLDVLTSTKAMMVFGILLSGVFMYLLAKEFWGEKGAVVSALFYMYAPYHALDIYVRGAVSEFWAIAFIPLLFYGIWKIFNQPKWKWVILTALSFTAVILSHNLTAMMITPFLLITILLRPGAIRYALYALLLGLGLSAFYWIPAILEMPFTDVFAQIGGGADFRDHFVCLRQLWESQWGFGGSASGCLDGLSFRIGKEHVLISLFALFVAFKIRAKDNQRSALITLSILFFVLSLFMTLELSKPVWEALPPLAFLQYPWRFLALATLCSSFLAGAFVWFLERTFSKRHIAPLLIILFLLYANLKLFKPQTILPRTARDYTSEANVKWTTSKISDEYMPKDFQKPKSLDDALQSKHTIIDGEGIVSGLEDTTQKLAFSLDGTTDVIFLAGIAPFPAWKATIDGSPSSYQTSRNGLLLKVPKGKHDVQFSFVETKAERGGTFISAISLLGMLGGIIRKRRK